MKALLVLLGMTILIAPIAARFLFGCDGRPRCPRPEDESVPVVFPGDESQQEEVTFP